MASGSSPGTSENACNSNNFDIIRELVTSQLKKDGIKLWLAPYTKEEDGQMGEFPIALITKYSSFFNIDFDQIASVLETLRENAVKKFASNKKFKACGVATLKLKFIDKKNSQENTMIHTGLQINGSELKEKLKTLFNFQEKLKIVCHGRIISDDKSLEEQGIRNNSFLMIIPTQEEQIKTEESTLSQVKRTKHAADILASKKGDNEDYYLEISDQNGKPLTLPDAERKSLLLTMSLHEKGKRILEERNFTEALVVLLSADEEFRQCRSEVLKAVDNYAILCLDIVWCYLQLKSIRELPSADEMLRNCESCFQKSYGENLERLVSLTGGSAKERVLYVRLYLLQAICAFHKGDIVLSSALLDKVEKEIRNLKVDDGSLSQLLSMGFLATESRLALRACQGDITAAVAYISRKREEKEKEMKERKERTKKEKESKKLGKTVNGSWIDVDTYNMLCEMGFPNVGAKEALRQTNNNMEGALRILQEKPELLEFLVDEDKNSSIGNISDDLIAQVISMGFDVVTARTMLEYYHGDINRTIEKLLECEGILPPEILEQRDQQKRATLSDGGESSRQEREKKQQEDKEEEDREIEAALYEMRGVFDKRHNEESHLDITLEEEAAFTNEYRTMIITRTHMAKR